MDPKQVVVRDIMSKSVVAVDATATINDAAKMMEDTRVGAVIIMEDNAPVGIVTDRDFAVKVAAHAYQISGPIRGIMSAPLVGIGPEESVWMISELMYTKGIRKLPVIDGGAVVGMVTATDLVNRLAVSTERDIQSMYHESVIRVYKDYSPYN